MTDPAARPTVASADLTVPKRVMITGGAGFLGINLVRLLRARGVEVTSLDVAPFDYPERGDVTVVEGDIRKREDVDRAMDGVDMVVHTAAALPPRSSWSKAIFVISTITSGC